jgi:hypothetical protein
MAEPTEKQLNRIQELIAHPGMADHLDSMSDQRFQTWLETRGGCGIAINWMKAKVARWEKEQDEPE